MFTLQGISASPRAAFTPGFMRGEVENDTADRAGARLLWLSLVLYRALERAIASATIRRRDFFIADGTPPLWQRWMRIAAILPVRDTTSPSCLNGPVVRAPDDAQRKGQLRPCCGKYLTLSLVVTQPSLDFHIPPVRYQKVRGVGVLRAINKGNDKAVALILKALARMTQIAGIVGFPSRAKEHADVGTSAANARGVPRGYSVGRWLPDTVGACTSVPAIFAGHVAGKNGKRLATISARDNYRRFSMASFAQFRIDAKTAHSVTTCTTVAIPRNVAGLCTNWSAAASAFVDRPLSRLLATGLIGTIVPTVAPLAVALKHLAAKCTSERFHSVIVTHLGIARKVTQAPMVRR